MDDESSKSGTEPSNVPVKDVLTDQTTNFNGSSPDVTAEHCSPGATQSYTSGPTHDSGPISDVVSTSQSRFQRLRKHAKGGLGQVFVARDIELQRDVALKEILPKHSHDPRGYTRFVLEAQVTGLLEHPGIVPVYGMGHNPDGTPYYAMRFIRGQAFDKLLEEFHHQHPTKASSFYYSRAFRGLLSRFIDVCNAIQYAHEKGVLHRDIKPANVMLGEYGETLVVDWGLAKILSGTSTQQAHISLPIAGLEVGSLLSTLDGDVVGTPAYMSPEQARGSNTDLTPASDIFSLGSMLFNIATGERPVIGRTANEIIINIQKGQLRRIRDVNRYVPKGLDAICAKAMSPNQESRYNTARSLAEDLERWLADELAEAYRGHETWPDFFGRLIRRYRTLTISIAVSLGLVSAISFVALVVVNQARLQEKTAKTLAKAAQVDALKRYQISRDAIDRWLVNSSDSLAYFPATQTLRTELLKSAEEDYAKLAATVSDDTDLELERLKAILRLGDISVDQEKYEEAATRYEMANRLVEDSLKKISRDAVQTRVLWQLEAARLHRQQALLSMTTGATAAAETHLLTAMQTLERLVEANPKSEKVLSSLAMIRVTRAQLCLDQVQFDEALLQLAAAKTALRQSPAFNTSEVQRRFASALKLEGQVYGHIGKYEESSTSFSTAIQVFKSLHESSPDVPSYLDDLAATYIARVSLLRSRGDLDQQCSDLLYSSECYRQLHQALPDIPRYRESWALSLADLGLVQLEQLHLIEAQTHLQQAKDEFSALVSFYPQVASFRSGLALALDGLGQIHTEQSKATDAVALLDTALETFAVLARETATSGTLSNETSDFIQRVAVAGIHRGQALRLAGNTQAARKAIDESTILLNELAARAPQAADLRNLLGFAAYRHASLLWQMGDQDLAKESFKRAIGHWQANSELTGTAESYYQVAWFHLMCPALDLTDPPTAVQAAKQAHALCPNAHRFQACLTEAFAQSGDANEAVKLRDQLAMLDAPDIDVSCARLATSVALKDWPTAKLLLEDAKRVRMELCPGNLDRLDKLERYSQSLADK